MFVGRPTLVCHEPAGFDPNKLLGRDPSHAAASSFTRMGTVGSLRRWHPSKQRTPTHRSASYHFSIWHKPERIPGCTFLAGVPCTKSYLENSRFFGSHVAWYRRIRRLATTPQYRRAREPWCVSAKKNGTSMPHLRCRDQDTGRQQMPMQAPNIGADTWQDSHPGTNHRRSHQIHSLVFPIAQRHEQPAAAHRDLLHRFVQIDDVLEDLADGEQSHEYG